MNNNEIKDIIERKKSIINSYHNKINRAYVNIVNYRKRITNAEEEIKRLEGQYKDG